LRLRLSPAATERRGYSGLSRFLLEARARVMRRVSCGRDMSESETFSQLEIAHVLFTDIVGYSKKAIDQ
jgi:hypothetical protein